MYKHHISVRHRRYLLQEVKKYVQIWAALIFLSISCSSFQNGTYWSFIQLVCCENVAYMFGYCGTLYSKQNCDLLLRQPYRFIFNSHLQFCNLICLIDYNFSFFNMNIVLKFASAIPHECWKHFVPLYSHGHHRPWRYILDESVSLLTLIGNLVNFKWYRERQSTSSLGVSYTDLKYITAGVGYCLFVPRFTRASYQISISLTLSLYNPIITFEARVYIHHYEEC